ncbi:ATP-dependent helicase, partial [Streptomyces sp. MCAF7]
MGRKSVARVVVREPRTGTRIAPPLATPEAVAFATALLEGGWAAVFLPGEPARLGRLLLWNPAGMVARDVTAPTSVAHESAELVLPHGRSVRRRRVDGYALPVGVAVAALAGVRPLHPSAIAWQAGPLTAAQRQTLDALAAAFPPHAHCLPEPGPAPLRIAEPAALVS